MIGAIGPILFCIDNHSGKYHTLISNAVQSYIYGEDIDIDNREGQEFADYMIQRIRTMMI